MNKNEGQYNLNFEMAEAAKLGPVAHQLSVQNPPNGTVQRSMKLQNNELSES